jgi:ankyrin repeat protein
MRDPTDEVKTMTTITERQTAIDDFLERAAKAMFPKSRETLIDVRTRNAEGDTALHLAALWGDEEAVKQLLMSGAFVDERGAAGRSALYYAVLKGHAAVAERLLAAGADPDLCMDLGMSPRVVAHQLRDERLIRLMEP